ncbi:alpha-tectorin-like isoform X2 [Hyla sarda]|uniref:alpha-tectorin-like isoform X2 n=2 Tax=Hyla sarda TaxID=327740 RepID=UPI0024C391A2|nr:alpha-tectorin-like isoform X2 [Hyla sarda]
MRRQCADIGETDTKMGTWNCIMVVLLALLSVLSSGYGHLSYTHPGSIMYRYGPAYKDMLTEFEDDGGTDSIALTHSFTYFDEIHRSLFVNNNGAISFKTPVTAYTPDGFPLPEYTMICPYWADCDNEINGTIGFRQTTEPEFMKQLSDDINGAFEGLEFEADWAFVATWDEVAYHGSESDKTNTFQCVLVVDNRRSVVIFNYHDIQWTTGTASGGHPLTGLGGIPAQAGFNTGNTYFNMPNSRTEHILNVKSSSNVGKPGRWMFQVDEARLKAPGGCFHQDTFLHYGQTIWTDEKCGEKCSCKHQGKMQCEDKGCDEGHVCAPSGRHFMCQIDEIDC